MSNEEGVFYKVAGGKVSRVRLVESEHVRLSDFMKNLTEQAPKELSTPPLPPNTVRYIKQPTRRNFVETFIVFSPPQMLTVSFRARRRPGGQHDLFDVSFPGMLFKISFDSSGAMGKPTAAVVKTRPQRDQEQLFKPHIPNIFNDHSDNMGEICMTPMNIRGDRAKSCSDTILNFFTGQPFNDDLNYWPPGISSFSEWETKTKEDPRWIEEANWPYLCTFGEWCSRPARIY